ncbi:hypothetical protein vBCtySFA88_00044 [Clostridium phage vB_CtyS-FA88]|nr:hypothetical protein vBCtySFA88_00044 [Clostridium phage vB_CtyS-FA88]
MVRLSKYRYFISYYFWDSEGRYGIGNMNMTRKYSKLSPGNLGGKGLLNLIKQKVNPCVVKVEIINVQPLFK